jgi:hypothetical protein
MPACEPSKRISVLAEGCLARAKCAGNMVEKRGCEAEGLVEYDL